MTSPLTQHEISFDIVWGDMDALGHVNNARYLDYFQEARINWLIQQQIYLTENTGPVVIHVACSFLKPVVYPARVTIKSNAHSLGRSSFTMDHFLYQDERLMAQGVSKIVWVDYTLGKSIEVPDSLRKLFS